MTYAEILARVESVTGHAPRRSGHGHEAHCPALAHDDKNRSLSLAEGDDGRTLWNCHKPGCEAADGVRGLGLTLADLYVSADTSPDWDPKRDGSVTTATYAYTDASGALLFEKLRREPKPGHPAQGLSKSFTQRRPDPDRPGRWLYGLGDIERPLFRLPEVLAAVESGRLVFGVEGEKDADRLDSHGFVATCNDGGAGKWRPQHTAALDGALVVLIPDHDASGRAHVRQVCEALDGVAESVVVLALDTLPDGSPMPVKGDVSDWFDAGGTVEDFKELVRQAPTADAVDLDTEAGAVDDPGRPTIPDRAFALLPPALADACSRFTRWSERHAYLVSLLVCLSAGLPAVRFRYGRRYLSPHLFAFLVGDAASGKGVVELARAWLDPIDDDLSRRSTEVREAWATKKAERDRLRRSRKKADQEEVRLLDETDPLGPEPPLRYILVGEDTTSAGLVDAEHDNEEGVALVSTEADTVTDANSKEHGRFSSIFRKAFHNERHAENRRSGGRLVVAAARLAVLLAGTRDQVRGLFEKGVEDGLYSRFVFYHLGGALRYESQRAVSEDVEFDRMTAARGADALAIHRALTGRDVDAEGRTAPLYVDLSVSDWDRMDAEVGSLFDRLFVDADANPALAATVKRTSVVCYRIAVTLAVWRAYGAGVDLRAASSLTVGPEDAEAARLLALVFAETAIRQAAEFGQRYQADPGDGMGGAHRTTTADRDVLDALADVFSPAELVEAGEKVGMSRATVYRRRSDWIEAGLIAEEKEGRRTVYRKVPMPDAAAFVGDGLAGSLPELSTALSTPPPTWGEDPPF